MLRLYRVIPGPGGHGVGVNVIKRHHALQGIALSLCRILAATKAETGDDTGRGQCVEEMPTTAYCDKEPLSRL